MIILMTAVVSILFLGACSPSTDRSHGYSEAIAAEPKPSPLREALTADRTLAAHRAVPTYFSTIDFRNFRYPFGRTSHGQLELPGEIGGTSYLLDDVFYVDLAGGPDKEAVVFIQEVNCGVSCDGVATNIYVYGMRGKRARLQGSIETGSRSGGCSIKSILVEAKTGRLVQFGPCTRNPGFDNAQASCKFCSKGETESTWSFVGRALRRTKASELNTPETNVMNYRSEITIR